MFTVVGEHVFPFLRTDLARNLGGEDSTYAQHMKDARFTIPTPALLARVVDMLDHVPTACCSAQERYRVRQGDYRILYTIEDAALRRRLREDGGIDGADLTGSR